MSVEWHGAERLTMAISGSGRKVMEQSSQVVRNNTEKLKASAKAKAPVDTSFLKDHITSSYPNRLEGHVKSEAAYSAYQEYGTRFQTGTAYIRPALQEIEPQFKQDMTNVLKGVFE
ncbi:phage protein, HK97 gp10 family [Streptococcus infantarius subsp. infantarius]|nr:phage protein, HK97 gp10 family [Streptococcus infantarius subsp. infantarius]MCO4575506.1 phage protein, HK97 gp10 family [Streptococcus infantarius subsp. infantarius]